MAAVVVYGIIVIVVLGIILSLFAYVRVPNDKMAFISGFRKRMVSGRLAFYVRAFERVDYLDLAVFSVDVDTKQFVPTNDFINIKADAIVKLQVGTTQDIMLIASKNFLNKNHEYMSNAIKDVLEGNLREIIGQMNLKDMVQNRKVFNQKVEENVIDDLRKMGLELKSFNVQSFTDEKGAIDNLGIENTSRISKDASIAKANSEKEVAIAKAQAYKEAQDIEIKTEEEIAEKQNALKIKQADLKIESDTKQALADITYDIQKEKNRKEYEEVIGDANFTQQDQAIRANKAKLESEIKIDQQIKADAKLYNMTKDAEARLVEEQKHADAELYKRQKQAEGIKLQALAEAEAQKIQAEAEANAIKLKMLAEAEGIEARGNAEAQAKEKMLLAEARGKKETLLAEAEGLDKKAEAMKKYGEAAVAEMYFKALPEVAKNVAAPLHNIDKITMYGDGNTNKLISDITQSIGKINDGISDGAGIDIKSLLAGFLGGKVLDNINSKSTDGKEEEILSNKENVDKKNGGK